MVLCSLSGELEALETFTLGPVPTAMWDLARVMPLARQKRQANGEHNGVNANFVQ